MATTVATGGIGFVSSRHREKAWVPVDRPGCSQSAHSMQASDLSAMSARRYGGGHPLSDCTTYLVPKLSSSCRRMMSSFEKNNLYGVKLSVRVVCQAVVKDEVSTTLVASWSDEAGEGGGGGADQTRVVKSSTEWTSFTSEKVKVGVRKGKVKVVQEKESIKVMTKKEMKVTKETKDTNKQQEHVEKSLEAIGVRNASLAKCVNEGVGMTEVEMLEWMNMLKRLGVAHTEIVSMVGKDASVLRAHIPDVELLWVHLRDELGLDRGTIASMSLQWPALLLCSVQHVKDVSDYFVSVGIDPDDVPGVFAARPQLLNNSVERIHHSVDCLLWAGVLPEDLARILKKVPELFSDVTQKNLKSKLEFLLGAGLGAGALGKAVARRPNILNYSLDSMRTTSLYLGTLMHTRDVAKLVKRYAEVLVLDPQRKMVPIVNYLLTLGVHPDNLGKVILRRPQLLGYTIPGLQPTVQYLMELGVKQEMLGKVITTSPQVLTLNVEEKLKPVVEFFRSIGLNKERDMEMLLIRNAQILCCSIEKNLRPKFTFFKGLGFTETSIAHMIVLFPSMLGQSIEGSLDPKFKYLVDEMNRSIDEVVDFPQYFGYSLDRRIRPRHEKLKDKSISTSLASMLACVDNDFNARYLSGQPPSRSTYKKKAPR